MSKIVLKVNGLEFGGWTNISIEKSLSSMAGSFGLAATDIFPGNAQKWGLAIGDECSVEIADQKIITGYIEDIPISYDASGHNIQIGGRDKTGDLVDCPFVETPNEWKEKAVEEIIKALCDPFDISVNTDDSVTDQATFKMPEFKANEGDAVFDLILKLCQMKAILPVSYGDGALTLTRAGGRFTNDPLEKGVNILSGSIDQSNKERFQTYIVKGQGSMTDQKEVADAAHPVGEQTDDVILRYRPIVIFTETPCDAARCLDRARWEATKRAGASRKLQYKVQGWTQSNGIIWPLNSLVKVKDDFLQIDGTLLISSINYTKDNESGTTTTMTLVDPDTYALLEEPIKKIKSGVDWKTKLTVQ